MRTIKRQDGMTIINAEKAMGICACENNNTWIITVFDTWAGDDTVGLLGTYSTEKRALKVLNNLNTWLTDIIEQEHECESISSYYSQRHWHMCFQMPPDSEELDI